MFLAFWFSGIRVLTWFAVYDAFVSVLSLILIVSILLDVISRIVEYISISSHVWNSSKHENGI